MTDIFVQSSNSISSHSTLAKKKGKRSKEKRSDWKGGHKNVTLWVDSKPPQWKSKHPPFPSSIRRKGPAINAHSTIHWPL
jgi:hypothetical protein